MQYETKYEPPLSLHTKKWKYPVVYIMNRQKAKTSVSVWSSLFSNNVKKVFTAVVSTEE